MTTRYIHVLACVVVRCLAWRDTIVLAVGSPAEAHNRAMLEAELDGDEAVSGAIRKLSKELHAPNDIYRQKVVKNAFFVSRSFGFIVLAVQQQKQQT